MHWPIQHRSRIVFLCEKSLNSKLHLYEKCHMVTEFVCFLFLCRFLGFGGVFHFTQVIMPTGISCSWCCLSPFHHQGCFLLCSQSQQPVPPCSFSSLVWEEPIDFSDLPNGQGSASWALPAGVPFFPLIFDCTFSMLFLLGTLELSVQAHSLTGSCLITRSLCSFSTRSPPYLIQFGSLYLCIFRCVSLSFC